MYGRSGDRRDLLQKMIAAGKDSKSTRNDGQPLSDEEIIVEITNLIFAGTDTTGITFSYIFWELANHPEWQDKLQNELKEVDWNGKAVPEYKDVSKLPILDALVHETLRLHPASPASLPRIAPLQDGLVDGVKIPKNVRNGPYASLFWTAHYSEADTKDLSSTDRCFLPRTDDPTRSRHLSRTRFIPPWSLAQQQQRNQSGNA